MVRQQVLAAQQGDRSAFGGLVELYQHAATAVALSIVRDVAQSEDVAQQAFVQAWQHIPSLQNPDSFVPWLLQLVRREALQALRKNKRAKLRDHAWRGVQPSEHESPAETLARQAMYQNLYTALDEVPPECREILLLYYREGQSGVQVANLLAVSEAAVRKRLERARAILRERYEAVADAAKKTGPGTAFVLAVLALVGSTVQAAPFKPMSKPFALAASKLAAFPIGIAVLIALVVTTFLQPPAPQPAAVAPTVSQKKTGPGTVFRTGHNDADRKTVPGPVLARIDGLLRDPDGPVADATIVIKDETTVRATLRSASDGSFSAVDLPPGTYSLEATRDGWLETRGNDSLVLRAGDGYLFEGEWHPAERSVVRVIDDLGAPVVGLIVELDARQDLRTVSGADGLVPITQRLPIEAVNARVYEGVPDEEHLVLGRYIERERGKSLDIVVPRLGEILLTTKFHPTNSPNFVHLAPVLGFGEMGASRIVSLAGPQPITVKIPAQTLLPRATPRVRQAPQTRASIALLAVQKPSLAATPPVELLNSPSSERKNRCDLAPCLDTSILAL